MEKLTNLEKKILRGLEKDILNTNFIYHDDGYKGSRFVIYDNSNFLYSSEVWDKFPGPIYYRYEDQGNGHGEKEYGYS